MRAIIIQNPQAGLQPPPTDDVLRLVQNEGFTVCALASPSERELEEALREKADIIVLIGGDGTVRHFFKHFPSSLPPLLLIPTGTANNIASSLRLPAIPNQINLSCVNSRIPFHYGKVHIDGRSNFFLESIGAGMIARMMVLMHFRKLSDPYFYDYQQEKYEESLHLLRGIIHSQSAQYCRLQIDGKDFSGKYLFVEVMNIPMIGPNLELASVSDPTDNYLEVVCLRPEDRNAFEKELIRRLNGVPFTLNLPAKRCRSVMLSWEGVNIHIDGEAFKEYDNEELRIEVSSESLCFYKNGKVEQ